MSPPVNSPLNQTVPIRPQGPPDRTGKRRGFLLDLAGMETPPRPTDPVNRISPLLVLFWVLALEWTIARPGVGLFVTGAVGLLILVVVWWWIRRYSNWWPRVAALALVQVSSLGVLTVVATMGWQHVLAVGSGWLLWLALRADQRNLGAIMAGRTASVSMFTAVLFSWLVILSFGIGVFVVWPWWSLAIGGAGLSVLAAVVTWSAADIPLRKSWSYLPWVAVGGFELMLASWWLPTPVYVGSIVGVTVLMLWLQAMRHVLIGDWEPGRGRRYLVVGGSVIGAVLVTARWM